MLKRGRVRVAEAQEVHNYQQPTVKQGRSSNVRTPSLPLLWGSTGVDYALAWDMRTVESKKRGETGGNERERESARGCVVQARYRKANL